MTGFMDVYFAFGILLNDGLGHNILAIQYTGGLDLLDSFLGGVLAIEGKGHNIVYS
jgi:hypothetical protein